MAIEIAAAVESLHAAFTIVKGAINARDEAKVKEALLDISDRLFTLYKQASVLIAENSDLQAQVQRLKEQEIERQNLVLHEVRPGAFALRAQATGDGEAPMHYVCQACRGAGKKVVLRLDNSMLGPELCCPADAKHNIYVGTDYVDALLR